MLAPMRARANVPCPGCLYLCQLRSSFRISFNLHRRILIFSVGLGVLLLGVAAQWRYHSSVIRPGAKLEIAGVHISAPLSLDSFTLAEGAGKTPFSRESLGGKWSFLFFGYTYCPDVCPLTLAVLNKVQRQLAENGADQDTSFVFVSVDPARDTPERLAEYVRYFNAQFRGVSGNPDQIDRLTGPLGIHYAVPENPPDPTQYEVTHSSVVPLINPDGKLQALFTSPSDPVTIANDFIRIRDHYRDTR